MVEMRLNHLHPHKKDGGHTETAGLPRRGHAEEDPVGLPRREHPEEAPHALPKRGNAEAPSAALPKRHGHHGAEDHGDMAELPRRGSVDEASGPQPHGGRAAQEHPGLPRRGHADDPHGRPRDHAHHPPAPGAAAAAAPTREDKGGLRLDMESCRKTFDAFDRDKSGYLDLEELTKLAEALWNSAHPDGPQLDRQSRAVPAESAAPRLPAFVGACHGRPSPIPPARKIHKPCTRPRSPPTRSPPTPRPGSVVRPGLLGRTPSPRFPTSAAARLPPHRPLPDSLPPPPLPPPPSPPP